MTLEAIKGAIAELSDEEKTYLASWLMEQQMDEWDKQMHEDFSPEGRGMPLVEKVKADIRTGKFKPMVEGHRAEH